MKKIALYIYGSMVMVISAQSQEKIVEDWQGKPRSHSVPAEYALESAIVIEENVRLKYVDEDDKQLWMHMTKHRIIKIMDEKGIEDFNKMSIPVYSDEVMEVIKARTILANGTVIDVQKDQMKESISDDGGKNIVFAMDGLEKNAEVELSFRYKKPAATFGKEFFQFSIPVVHATFDLSSPSRMEFEEKGYNGFPTTSDSLIDGTRYLHVEQNKIPALRSEDYSFLDINRMRAEYKISYMPEENNMVRKFTWQELAERLYSAAYVLSDKENNAIEMYLNNIGVANTDHEEDKIIMIERAIKNDITLYKKMDGDNACKLDNVITTKSATEAGLIHLFAACFSKAGVKNELGLTTNRGLNLFDPEFENWNALENYVFYFPSLKKFLSPASIYIRYPFTSTEVLNNKGVFCKLTTIGDVTNAIANIRTISPESAVNSQNDILADILLSNNMEATADITYSCTGYCAMGNRELIMFLPKDKLKELVQSIVSVADKPEDILKYAITGDSFENYTINKPLLIKAEVAMPQFVEKAGTKYLLRIGDVIGKQTELYQTEERKQPVDFEYPHYLNRTITVNIPEGYKIINPDATKIQADYKDEAGKATIGFYSDYKIEGNKLIVNISEFYSQIHFPLSNYEAFRKVVNASADFNKVKLLIGKM